jgi:DNA ligase 1
MQNGQTVGCCFKQRRRVYPGHTGSPMDEPAKTIKAGDHGVPGGENMLVRLDGSIRYFTVRETAWRVGGAGRFQMKKPMAIMQAVVRQPVVFFAFDILRYKGEDLRGRALPERKAILSQGLTEKHFSRVLSVDGDGMSLFEVIKGKKLEGMVAKRKDSRYVDRREPSWLKIINYSYAMSRFPGTARINSDGCCSIKEDRSECWNWLCRLFIRRRSTTCQRNSLRVRTETLFMSSRALNARVRFRNWYRSGMIRSPEFVDFVV